MKSFLLFLSLFTISLNTACADLRIIETSRVIDTINPPEVILSSEIVIDEDAFVDPKFVRDFCEYYLSSVTWPDNKELRLGWSYFPEDAKEALLNSCVKRELANSYEIKE